LEIAGLLLLLRILHQFLWRLSVHSDGEGQAKK
jgi:hypothetical protein